MKVICHCKHP